MIFPGCSVSLPPDSDVTAASVVLFWHSEWSTDRHLLISLDRPPGSHDYTHPLLIPLLLLLTSPRIPEKNLPLRDCSSSRSNVYPGHGIRPVSDSNCGLSSSSSSYRMAKTLSNVVDSGSELFGVYLLYHRPYIESRETSFEIKQWEDVISMLIWIQTKNQTLSRNSRCAKIRPPNCFFFSGNFRQLSWPSSFKILWKPR